MSEREDKNRGGRPLAEVLAGLQTIVAELAVSQSAAPVTKTEVARRLGVDKVTLWRHEKVSQDVRDLVKQLLDAGRAIHGQPSEASDGHSAADVRLPEPDASEWAGLPDPELARRASRHIKVAQGAMQRFVGQTRRFKHASDLPRATFHLQRSIQQASSALQELRALTEEWLRRSRAGGTKTKDGELPLTPGDEDSNPLF